MRVSDVLTLYDYNDWANRRILDAAARVTQEQFIAPASYSYGSLRGTLVHTLNAELIWRSRWQGEPVTMLREEDVPAVAALTERWRQEERRLRDYLAGLRDEDLDRPLSYMTSTGASYTQTLWPLLVHVVNHGTQHRSEAAVMLTDFGQSPGDIDFVVFLRERG